MLCSLSTLNESDLKSIKALETEIGKPLLSFTCRDIQPASLDDEVLVKIQELEKKLAISLVAVEN